MPPRRRAHVQALAAPCSGIADLPDGVLASVLQHLTQTERLQHAALVCKRFSDLSCSPDLVADTEVSIQGGSDVLARARSLLAWLAKHGKHIGNLRFTLDPQEGCSAAEKHELAALVAACLSACGGPAGRLEDVWVGDDTPLATTAWLLLMPKLEAAALGSMEAALTLTDGVHSLSRLESLTLHGKPLQLPAQLPPSLTRLEVSNKGNLEMPPQIVQLSGLRLLHLVYCKYSQGSMASLSRLAPTLTELKMESCTQLPPTLSALTGLQRLVLSGRPTSGASVADELDASLSQLQQLTALALVNGNLTDLPPAINSLTRLVRFAFNSASDEATPQLPHGPWLRRLQVLGADATTLAKSVAALAKAPQLKAVCMAGMPGVREGATNDDWRAFYDWAASYKPLARLTFQLNGEDEDEDDTRDAPFTRKVFDDIMRLRSACPKLEVFRYGSPEHPTDFIDDDF